MAERAAVIKGLDLAAGLGFTKVMVESASIKCLKGDIEKGAWEIYPLLLEIRSKKINFEDLHWKWSTHKANGESHHIALLALRIVERQSWVDRPPISLVFAQGRPSLSSKLILGVLAAPLDNPLLVACGKLSCFCLGYDLAEAYVPRDLHWKKLKMEKQERAKLGTAESKVLNELFEHCSDGLSSTRTRNNLKAGTISVFLDFDLPLSSSSILSFFLCLKILKSLSTYT